MLYFRIQSGVKLSISLQKNKAIVVFLAKFFATYFILFGIYSFYLSKTQKKGDVFSCAPITQTVANHVDKIATMLGYNSFIQQSPNELSIQFMLDDYYTSRIIEGCNSISVIILFLSFIIAFAGSLKRTLLFGLFGAALIYVVNVLRIIALTILYHKFPEYQHILHDLVFPAVIYGLTFMLWVTWVKFFSNLNRNEA